MLFSNNLEMLILVTRLIKVKLVPALFTYFSVANNISQPLVRDFILECCT